MTDEAPRPRPWFQFHLATCVVLMFAAGVMLWLNLRLHIEARDSGDSVGTIIVDYSRGWPWHAQHVRRAQIVHVTFGKKGATAYFNEPWIQPEEIDWTGMSFEFTEELRELLRRPDLTEGQWSFSCLAANLGVALALLLSPGLGVEYLLRRRARRTLTAENG